MYALFVSDNLRCVDTYRGASIEALGDTTRRAIFERLAEGPFAVGELARNLPVSRPAVSQHLRVLKDAGLVLDRKAGNRRLYRLNAAGIEALRDYFDRFWTQALESFKEIAEQDEE